MQVRLWNGSVLEGRLAIGRWSEKGHPVLVAGGQAYGPDDVKEVLSASDEERKMAGPEWSAIWDAAPHFSPVQWFAARPGCWIVLALALYRLIHALLTYRPWEQP